MDKKVLTVVTHSPKPALKRIVYRQTVITAEKASRNNLATSTDAYILFQEDR
jgi:hypothetical protein